MLCVNKPFQSLKICRRGQIFGNILVFSSSTPLLKKFSSSTLWTHYTRQDIIPRIKSSKTWVMRREMSFEEVNLILWNMEVGVCSSTVFSDYFPFLILANWYLCVAYLALWENFYLPSRSWFAFSKNFVSYETKK